MNLAIPKLFLSSVCLLSLISISLFFCYIFWDISLTLSFNTFNTFFHFCFHGFFLFFCFFLNLFYFYFYFWLHWVFALSSCRERGPLFIVRASHCGGLSCCRARALGARAPGARASAAVARGLQSAGSAVVAHGPSCSTARGILPDQGSNTCTPHWQADSQPLRHQGSPASMFLIPKSSSLLPRCSFLWHMALASWLHYILLLSMKLYFFLLHFTLTLFPQVPFL